MLSSISFASSEVISFKKFVMLACPLPLHTQFCNPLMPLSCHFFNIHSDTDISFFGFFVGVSLPFSSQAFLSFLASEITLSFRRISRGFSSNSLQHLLISSFLSRDNSTNLSLNFAPPPPQFSKTSRNLWGNST